MSNEKQNNSGIGSDVPLVFDTGKQENLIPISNEKAQAAVSIMAENATLMRSELLTKLLNPGKDINFECGYPDTISIEDYKGMFVRMGVATRVVELYSEESWALLPKVYETEDAEETEFEKEFKSLEKKRHLFQYLQRIDTLSGIGRFGVLLLGIDDGLELEKPVVGINEITGEKEGDSKYELLYMKPFDESVVEIKRKESNVKSPRYGLPTAYSIKFEDTSGKTSTSQTKEVHWTRIIHIADNRESSDIYGKPRMEKIYNQLLDIRKVLGGSGEMFWKGGFPGLSFKVDPNQTLTDEDKDAMKDEMRNYSQSLQRYLSFVGVEVQSLNTQVADPSGHLDTQIDSICISLGVPKRIFMGSERGELASSQDTGAWNKRVSKRLEGYVSPLLIRPLVDRLIAFGVLPEIEEYFIGWPDLNAPSNEEVAEIAVKRTDAMSKYVAGGVDNLIAPKEFLTLVMGFTTEEAESIDDAVKEHIDIKEDEVIAGEEQEQKEKKES